MEGLSLPSGDHAGCPKRRLTIMARGLRCCHSVLRGSRVITGLTMIYRPSGCWAEYRFINTILAEKGITTPLGV